MISDKIVNCYYILNCSLMFLVFGYWQVSDTRHAFHKKHRS